MADQYGAAEAAAALRLTAQDLKDLGVIDRVIGSRSAVLTGIGPRS